MGLFRIDIQVPMVEKAVLIGFLVFDKHRKVLAVIFGVCFDLRAHDKPIDLLVFDVAYVVRAEPPAF
jgi:hypothetical protein